MNEPKPSTGRTRARQHSDRRWLTPCCERVPHPVDGDRFVCVSCGALYADTGDLFNALTDGKSGWLARRVYGPTLAG